MTGLLHRDNDLGGYTKPFYKAKRPIKLLASDPSSIGSTRRAIYNFRKTHGLLLDGGEANFDNYELVHERDLVRKKLAERAPVTDDFLDDASYPVLYCRDS